MMAIPGVFSTAAEATAAVGVASIGGVVNVAGRAQVTWELGTGAD